jgi:hypothetical protein
VLHAARVENIGMIVKVVAHSPWPFEESWTVESCGALIRGFLSMSCIPVSTPRAECPDAWLCPIRPDEADDGAATTRELEVAA